MPGSARPCSTGSPIRPTLSKQVRSRTAFAEPCGRNAKSDLWRTRRSILLPLRPPGYAPAERNSTLLTFNVPRWARLNRRSGPNQLAKRNHGTVFPRACPGSRRLLLQPEVSSVVVIIGNVLGEESLQMALIQGDYVVEQVAAAASDPTLGDPIGEGRQLQRMATLPIPTSR